MSSLGQLSRFSFYLACMIFVFGCGQPTSGTKDQNRISEKSRAGIKSTRDFAETSASVGKSAIQFATHGKDYGVNFAYRNGEEAWLVAMIESNGGGIGIIDFDRDGRWDIFVPGGGQLTPAKIPIMVHNGLFHQVKPGAFLRVDSSANVSKGVCYSFGANVGDFDDDGFTDIFISGYFGQQLLRNMGDGTFEDTTGPAGFHHRGWSSSSAWFDLDGDSDLDLYIAHYGVWSPELEKKCFNSQGDVDRCAPADFAGEPDEVWINNGDGSFQDRSETIADIARRGVGVLACDFDQDGDTDLYVSNDEDPNSMLDNSEAGKLTEVGAQSGTSLGSRSIVDGSMGLALGDFDGNRKPDILVTNYQDEYCELYLNQSSKGREYFALGTRASGLMALGQAVVGWGTAFFDADHDGDEDLVVIAGHTSRKPIKSSNLQKSYFLENVNRKRLTSIGEDIGDFFRVVHAGRGMAIADIDDDGDIDFVVSMVEQPVEIVVNETPRSGNYLMIDLVGTKTNRDAIGAYVEFATKSHKLIRNRFGGGSYASTHASSLHVGLGNDDLVDTMIIHWGGDRVQTLRGIRANQRLVIVEE